jgi:hypothetical protein
MSTDIQKDIQYLRNEIMLHKGDTGEDVHGLPQNGEAGFMPYKMYTGVNGIFTTRQGFHKTGDTLVDIDTLDPGFYVFTTDNASGIPEGLSVGEVVTLDITKYAQGSRQYTLREGWKNRVWYKTLHAPDAATQAEQSTGWTMAVSGVMLWAGAISSGSATLSGSIDQFPYVEFIFRTSSGNRFSTIIGRTSQFWMCGANIPDTTDANILVSEMAVDITGTTAKITKNIGVLISQNSATRITDVNQGMALNAVIGRTI